MGGSFLADMRSLRKAGHNLPHIVSFFLKKDVEKRQETRRLTRLLADAKVGFDNKGTGDVISREHPFKQFHTRFTLVLFNPFRVTKRKREVYFVSKDSENFLHWL